MIYQSTVDVSPGIQRKSSTVDDRNVDLSDFEDFQVTSARDIVFSHLENPNHHKSLKRVPKSPQKIVPDQVTQF